MKRRATSSRVEAPATSATFTSSPARTLRVLVLDDDQDMCDLFAFLLGADEGFETETCADVASCLERLRAASARGAARPFDVLLRGLPL